MQTTIPCVQCRQPIRVTVQALIDAEKNPQAKISLLSGTLNATPCPNCRAPNTVLTPLLYHDAPKELLISYVPMELGLSHDAQEKAIGELLRELTTNLPQGAFKAYMLQPRQALTMQGLVDQVLQADGVTPEMLQAQRDRVKLVETFIQASEESLPELVQQHDARIDSQFFQTMTLALQQFVQQGREALAERTAYIQNRIVELSTFGKQLVEQTQAQEEAIKQVAEDVNALGDQAQHADFLKLVLRYAEDDNRLQALVGLVRPVFDYTFFQEMTQYISQAAAAERDALEELRERLLELTAQVDQQAQMAMQEAAGLLRAILTSPNPDEMIEANLPMIDSTFMQVLSLNIQDATRRADVNASARLKDIYNRVIAALQAHMPPELRFINELLSAPSDEAARSMMAQRANEFGASLLSAMDVVEEQLAAQGNPVLMERAAMLHREAAQALG
jgi:CpXC motif protein